jgi:hypothetical protein
MKFSHWLLMTFIGMGLLFFASGILIGRAMKPDISNNPLLFSALRPPAKKLNTALGILISEPEEVERTDIATLYLASLAGLPGTENLDLDGARAHFEELAMMVQKQTEATSKYQHSISADFKDTPESKAVVLVEALRSYEQDAERSMNTSRPESLFIRNSSRPAPAATHFASPLEASLAGRPFDYRPPMREDSILEIPHDVVTLNNPILIAAVGQLLGYPLYLVKAPDHLFVRWQSPDGQTLFDIDEIGKYGSIAEDPIRPDDDYERPPEDEIKAGGYFKSLTHAGLFAFFLQARGNYLHAHQRPFDAELAYTAAHRFAPDTPIYDANMLAVVGEEMRLVGVTWKDTEKNCPDYFNLSLPRPDNTVIIP